MQFPASGLASAADHTPGAELTGVALDHSEKVITVDDLLVAHAFIAKIDEAMNHYDVRSIYSTELADALAQTYDKNVAQNIILAARASSPISAITLPTRSRRAGHGSTSTRTRMGRLSSPSVPIASVTTSARRKRSRSCGHG